MARHPEYDYPDRPMTWEETFGVVMLAFVALAILLPCAVWRHKAELMLVLAIVLVGYTGVMDAVR